MQLIAVLNLISNLWICSYDLDIVLYYNMMTLKIVKNSQNIFALFDSLMDKNIFFFYIALSIFCATFNIIACV